MLAFKPHNCTQRQPYPGFRIPRRGWVRNFGNGTIEINEKVMHTAMILFTIFLRVDSVLVAHSEPSFSKAAYISSNVGLLNMLSICVLWSAKANGLSVAHYNRCTNNWDNYYKTRQSFSFFVSMTSYFIEKTLQWINPLPEHTLYVWNTPANIMLLKHIIHQKSCQPAFPSVSFDKTKRLTARKLHNTSQILWTKIPEIPSQNQKDYL